MVGDACGRNDPRCMSSGQDKKNKDKDKLKEKGKEKTKSRHKCEQKNKEYD